MAHQLPFTPSSPGTSLKFETLKLRNLVKQILPPLIIGPSHQAHDVAAGVEVEGAGLTHQLHSRFGNKLISLSAIAEMAAGNEVFPRRVAATGARDNMV